MDIDSLVVELLERLDIDEPVTVFELDLDEVARTRSVYIWCDLDTTLPASIGKATGKTREAPGA